MKVVDMIGKMNHVNQRALAHELVRKFSDDDVDVALILESLGFDKKTVQSAINYCCENE
jgi:hypothetical protein